MGIGISFSASGGKSKGGLGGTDKHNERKYKNKNLDNSNSSINFELSKYNEILVGTKNLYEDVRKTYKEEFSQALDEYNANQKRKDRRIYDYFEKISSDSKTNLYTEVIIQIGDEKIWKDKPFEEKQKMVEVFKKQIELMNEFYPNFKISNATVHLDETSPHLHIVGVGVSNRELAIQNKGEKQDKKRQNGLKKYVAQSEIFTSNNMKKFHKEFSEKSLKLYNEMYQTNEVLNDKQLHQKHLELSEYKKIAPIIKENQEKFDTLKKESLNFNSDLKSFCDNILNSKFLGQSVNELELEFKSKEDNQKIKSVNSENSEFKVMDNNQIDVINFNLFLLEKFKEKLENQKKINEKLKENLKVENEKFLKIENIKNSVVEKKGFLDKEIKIILPKEEYNSLMNYAVNGEKFNNKKNEVITKYNNLVDKYKSLLEKNDLLSVNLKNEKLLSSSLATENRDLENKLKISNSKNKKEFEKSIDREIYIEKLEKALPKEKVKEIKQEVQPKKEFWQTKSNEGWER